MISDHVKTIAESWRQHRIPRLSAGLAYYTMFALAPIIVILIAAAGTFLGEAEAQKRLIQEAGSLLGDRAAETIMVMVAGVRNRSSSLLATTVSALTLLYAMTRVFSQLQDAFNSVWEVEPKVRPNIIVRLRRRFAAFLATIGAGALLFAVVIVEPSARALIPRVTAYPVLTTAVESIVSWSILTFAFAMIYRVMPNVKLTWGDVLLGAAASGLAFTWAESLMVWYLKTSAMGSVYGAAGSFIVIMFWFYISSQILLLGAEITRVYTISHGSHARLAQSLLGDAPAEEAAK